jgi:hypothetical protein
MAQSASATRLAGLWPAQSFFAARTAGGTAAPSTNASTSQQGEKSGGISRQDTQSCCSLRGPKDAFDAAVAFRAARRMRATTSAEEGHLAGGTLGPSPPKWSRAPCRRGHLTSFYLGRYISHSLSDKGCPNHFVRRRRSGRRGSPYFTLRCRRFGQRAIESGDKVC